MECVGFLLSDEAEDLEIVVTERSARISGATYHSPPPDRVEDELFQTIQRNVQNNVKESVQP